MSIVIIVDPTSSVAVMIRYRVAYAEKRRAHCLLARHCGGALDLVLVAAHRQRSQLSRSRQPGVDVGRPGL
jgi:threonine dehydratase